MSQVATYDWLVETMTKHETVFDSKRIKQAWAIAEAAYKDTQHWTGIPLMDHVQGVLYTLMPFKPDEEAIIACLLHHILDQQYWTLQELEDNFGVHVRNLVRGVHLLARVTLRDRRNSVEDLRLMLLTVSEDMRTLLLILADRSFVLSHIEKLQTEEQKRIARDVLQLFAPVAARLGIYHLKHSLENRAFPAVYPDDAAHIQQQLQRIQNDYGQMVGAATEQLVDYLEKEGIKAVVSVREKQPYSIFRKLQQKGLSNIQDLYDLYAIRVIVASEAECYQVLGLLHRVSKPVANRFKDYIAFPKPNGYRSLHTTLMQLPGIEANNVLVELQVRTHSMHEDAQYGVAAHWLYKEGDTAAARWGAQLQSVLAGQEVVGAEEEALTSYVDHIYALTPKGEVIELPEGATPLDFAFLVHSDLGLRFHSAKVNGAIVPLNYEIENGDMVEIIKRGQPRPSPQWLKLLKMSSARSKLKRHLYAQDRPFLIVEGKRLVNEELRKRGLPELDADLSQLKKEDGKVLSKHQREDLLMKIGQGAERVMPLMHRLDEYRGQLQAPSLKKVGPKKASQTQVEFELESEVPLPTRCAKCCNPAKSRKSALMGVIGRQGMVVVHRKACGMLRNANPERMIKVWWKK